MAEAKAVRTGIQLYTGDEVGKPDLKVVRVYRPPEEVFAGDSLRSFTHAPVTVDHPAEAVTADNWKSLAVGEVSTMAKADGEWVHLPLILKDAAAIKAVEDGKRELSAGYTCQLDWTAGMTADGQPFDAQQRNIKINHLALVDRARAGPKARIGDGAGWGIDPITEDATPEKEMKMTLKTVTVDGIPVEVTDQGATVIATLQQRLADANTKFATAETAHQTALAAKDADLAKKDAEIDALKAKVMDANALDAAVQARGDLIAKAKAIAPTVETKGLSDAAIRKAVVSAKRGADKVADKSEAYIDAAFELLTEDAAREGTDPFRDTLRNGVVTTTTDRQAAVEAHGAMAARFNK